MIILFDLDTLNCTKKIYYLKFGIKMYKSRFIYIYINIYIYIYIYIIYIYYIYRLSAIVCNIK